MVWNIEQTAVKFPLDSVYTDQRKRLMRLVNSGTGDNVNSFAINYPETLMLVENNNIYFLPKKKEKEIKKSLLSADFKALI